MRIASSPRPASAGRQQHDRQRLARPIGSTSCARPLPTPAQRQLVKAALGMDDRLLERVAAGGATLSGVQWRQLREVLA